ncbi:MAG: envelope stress response membrane protein PspC [Desulfobacterales bacterium]|nr:envelope stress response membrane protein PspC [Desulfobacterales bacterium]MCP4160100.1 envelope stress response membrane protein PspC [Deltaproteobacteria bacterium]
MNLFNKLNNEGLFRARDGLFLGVCKGVAKFFDIPVIWVRAAVLFFFVISGFFPLFVIYFIAAFFMKPEPVIPFYTDDDREFYDTYVNSRHAALSRLKNTFNKLDRRIQRIEDVVTRREFDWDRKI